MIVGIVLGGIVLFVGLCELVRGIRVRKEVYMYVRNND